METLVVLRPCPQVGKPHPCSSILLCRVRLTLHDETADCQPLYLLHSKDETIDRYLVAFHGHSLEELEHDAHLTEV